MVSAISPSLKQAPIDRTIWGLDPLQLHMRYWAAHGVQVVRQGEPSAIITHAELFLLTDPRSLVLFRMTQHVLDALNWIQPDILFIRLHDTRERGYRERVITDRQDRFVRFQRLYEVVDPRLARVVLTPDREIAQLWQSATDPLSAWRRLRRHIPKHERSTLSVKGSVYDRTSDREVAVFLQDLVKTWKRPDATIAHARRRFDDGIWADTKAEIDGGAKLIGPVWVGAGRRIPDATTVIGPAVVWDDPGARPAAEAIEWLNIEVTEQPPTDIELAPLPPLGRAVKRLFDILFSLCALAVTLPFYPFIMLAIWFEDGRPWFFSHERETLGGRKFGCIKFRSMRKDAAKLTAAMAAQNQADGPQFFVDPNKDPRLTKVGHYLRKYDVDEWPQFINVLLGDMSIVGPRPSPEKENQYCPAWREARLSVRPGITGLWQIERTRRSGCDFQEWIKYDLEYVEKSSLWFDLKIIWKTIVMILRKAMRQ
jgi:lipopolysaccharide/colanic/teichoic acid biosynthesis glycosyltransferase